MTEMEKQYIAVKNSYPLPRIKVLSNGDFSGIVIIDKDLQHLKSTKNLGGSY
jgi:hypothetical protein